MLVRCGTGRSVDQTAAKALVAWDDGCRAVVGTVVEQVAETVRPRSLSDSESVLGSEAKVLMGTSDI